MSIPTKEVSIHVDTPTKNGKKTKTPRQYDAILKGALSLSFSEKVELRRELKASIDVELKNVAAMAENYLKIAQE